MSVGIISLMLNTSLWMCRGTKFKNYTSIRVTQNLNLKPPLTLYVKAQLRQNSH
jgi:hypothetical protein